jgi:hypothetical protein
VVHTSPEDLRRNLAEFGFQLFKLHLDLSEIRHKERHPPFNQLVQTGPSQGDVRKRSTRAGFLAAVGWFVVPFTLEPEIFGVLLGDGEAGTFKGALPTANTAVERA